MAMVVAIHTFLSDHIHNTDIIRPTPHPGLTRLGVMLMAPAMKILVHGGIFVAQLQCQTFIHRIV